MRAIDIDMTGETWVYRPPTHKLAWRNKSREIFIGAQGQAVIKLFLTAKVDDFLFSPRREREERYQAMRLQRKSKLQPSQEDRRQRKLKKVIGEHYSSRSYAKCIADACKKAKVPHWHPNQIRHLHATQVRRQYGIEAAGAVLGHSKLSTTELYAEKNRALAERIAKQVG
jgi:integrase